MAADGDPKHTTPNSQHRPDSTTISDTLHHSDNRPTTDDPNDYNDDAAPSPAASVMEFFMEPHSNGPRPQLDEYPSQLVGQAQHSDELLQYVGTTHYSDAPAQHPNWPTRFVFEDPSPPSDDSSQQPDDLSQQSDGISKSNDSRVDHPPSSECGHAETSDDDESLTDDDNSVDSDNDDIAEEDPHPLPAPPQITPGRGLNAEWQTFFRDSLRAADPDRDTRVLAPQPERGWPDPLPPPMHSAPNEPSGEAFTNKPREAFRLWSVNANGISSRDGFAALHTLCVSLASGFVDAVALQEPNVDFMQADICQKYEDSFKVHFGQARPRHRGDNVHLRAECVEAGRGSFGDIGQLGPTCDKSFLRQVGPLGICDVVRLRRRQHHGLQRI
jgi:hypothetical protein